MNFVEFIQLILRNKKWVFVMPLGTAILIFVLTRNLPKTYSSEMIIYTGIASGYNVENDMESKVDYHAANSKFDNLINTILSKETRKIVSLKLLASLLHRHEDIRRTISECKMDRFEWLADSAGMADVIGVTEQETFINLKSELLKGEENRIYQLLYGRYGNPFSIGTLATIKATRIGFSDMVKVEYTSEEAHITKKTLDILAEVFLEKYKGMRVGEVNNVVKYFEEQTKAALSKLQTAEAALKNFRINNKVINYYEQTKYIADQKQDYEQIESNLQMNLNGYQSALLKIESKLNNRAILQLQSDEVMKLRNDLTSEYTSMGLNLVQHNLSADSANPKIEILKSDLKESIQRLFQLTNSTEGVPGKNLLDQWVDLTIESEQTKAQLIVLEENKEAFEKIYDRFAPMGSDLNKLERDVDVSEKEYLSLLHNLNQARLRERNLIVNENIAVTDPPDLPVIPNSSKRMILVIAGFASSFILVIVVLIIGAYLDDSISNPLKLKKLTGISCATAFARVVKDSDVLFEQVHQASIRKWLLSVLDEGSGPTPSEILLVPFHSTDTDLQAMASDLSKGICDNLNAKALSNEMNSQGHIKIRISQWKERELFSNEELQKAGKIYLILDASLKLDEYCFEELEKWKAINSGIFAVLVNCRVHYLDKFLGEIPKKRSNFRIRIKGILNRYS